MRPIGLMRLRGLMRLIGLIGLIGLISSCSKELVPDPDGPVLAPTAIAFSADQQEQEVTRAATPLENLTTSFKVWGYKKLAAETQTVMEEYNVQWEENSAYSSTSNSSDWDYILTAYPHQTIKYWDWNAESYRFFGVTNGIDGAYNNTKDSYIFTFTADASDPTTTPYYSKLWFTDDTNNFGKPVRLEFMQPFALVRFMITLSDPTIPLLLEDDDFRPTTTGQRIGKKGDITITYPITGASQTETWNIAPATISKTLGSLTRRWTDAIETPPTAEDHYWETVLPVLGQGSYTFSIRVDGEEKTCVVPSQYMDWLPGYRYTYIFKVKGDGGVELATVRTAFLDWENAVDQEWNLYNW